ncbi:BREX-1 system adenine-specific DNA-methyltransferase PglX [Candidatus Bipolaricaulota bacterium]
MDTKALEKFAKTARRRLLDEVGAKLEHVLATDSAELREKADAIQELRAQIKASSKQAVVDRVAYTWFNRFCALRFMDANHYTHAGIVSPFPGHTQPEILQDAKQGHVAEELKHTVDAQRVLALLSGELPSSDPQQEAYRLLLVGMCNQYHKMMPFLFEKIADYTELLMPDDLLSEASLLHAMREAMTVEVCEDIEVIGWLYQFYISEKKDQVIGKVVKSEDIPAATQLFTPNWIVKYMVQNSLGAQWLATYPDSKIKEQMEYYIEPAEQTPEVQQQLRKITPTSLEPETMTLIDPASGSGHILVEAYELFKAMYLEKGYNEQDLPQLILEKNLFGLEICPRAAQLTGFALMMKGRADDRRLFERGVKLNVVALVDSAGFDAEKLIQDPTISARLAGTGLQPGDLYELKRLFEHATTFGSLIQVPEALAEKLPALKQLSEASNRDLFVSEALKRLGPLVQQAGLLAANYDAVVANPPYMGGRYMNREVRAFTSDHFPAAKSDLFSAFIVRCSGMGLANACIGMMSPNVWMYISTHEGLRQFILSERTVASLVELPLSGFKGATVQICSFVFRNMYVPSSKGSFVRLVNFKGGDLKMASFTRQAIAEPKCGWLFEAIQDEFMRVPGSPVAYWVTERTREIFGQGEPLGESVPVRQGLATADNDRFLRSWSEVSRGKCGFGLASRDEAAASGKKWFPYNKGGDFRKWFGNNEYLVNWEDDGRELNAFKPRAVIRNPSFYFLPSVTWSFVSSSYFGVRYSDSGAVFDVGGSSAFPVERDHHWVTGFLCSKQVFGFMKVMNPTLNFQVGNVAALPVLHRQVQPRIPEIDSVARVLIEAARADWDAYERSWDFQSLPILTVSSDPPPPPPPPPPPSNPATPPGSPRTRRQSPR